MRDSSYIVIAEHLSIISYLIVINESCVQNISFNKIDVPWDAPPWNINYVRSKYRTYNVPYCNVCIFHALAWKPWKLTRHVIAAHQHLAIISYVMSTINLVCIIFILIDLPYNHYNLLNPARYTRFALTQTNRLLLLAVLLFWTLLPGKLTVILPA